MRVGDVLAFRWSIRSGSRSLILFSGPGAYKACAFHLKTQLTLVRPSRAGACNFKIQRPGNYFFASSVGSDCKKKQFPTRLWLKSCSQSRC